MASGASFSRAYLIRGALTPPTGPVLEPARREPRPTSSVWACRFVDIYTAVREGLAVNIDELREAVDDPEGWAQEFECQFLDVQAVLLPYDLIASCESVEATGSVPSEYCQARLQYEVDLHSINRVTTASGAVTYRAPHSADGHADRCTALALALRAGAGQAACRPFWEFPELKINRVGWERRDRTLCL
jgi:phage FluMu gp28-like protein